MQNLIHRIFLILFLFSLFSGICLGQTRELITRPYLKLVNDSLIIKYDIISNNADDKYDVWIEITDATGKKINVYSVQGDIGNDIKAGLNKKIVWDLAADNIFLNANINVEIIAKKIIIPVKVKEEPEIIEEEPVLVKEEEKKEEIEEKELADRGPEEVKKKDTKESPKTTKSPKKIPARVKTGKHLLQSTIWPGWGLTSISNGKPYWLIGIAGAGCIGSSVYYNYQANTNYNDYLDSNDPAKINTYFDDAVMQDNISKALAYTAAGIWVADLGIVFIKACTMNRAYKRNKLSAFSFGSYIESNTDTPMLSLYFNF